MRISISLLQVALLTIVGCGAGAATQSNSSDVFIAFPRDFDGFDSWTAFDLGDDQADGINVVGRRRAYINHVPAHDSATFPVGTIVVKTIGDDQPVPGQIFAMAKRGGTYNAKGAAGWEWFELMKTTAAPLIVWRGIVPPAGEMYAGVAGGACNTCHALGAANDFVPSDELALAQF